MDFLILSTSFMAFFAAIVVGGISIGLYKKCPESPKVLCNFLIIISWCTVQALVSVALLCLWASEAGR